MTEALKVQLVHEVEMILKLVLRVFAIGDAALKHFGDIGQGNVVAGCGLVKGDSVDFHDITSFRGDCSTHNNNVKGGGTMPQIEEMVKLLRELTEEDRLIVMGGMMALKAKHDAADEAA